MSIRGNLHIVNNSDTVFVRSNRVGNNLHARGNHGRFLRLRDNRVGTRSNGNLVVENNKTVTRLRSNRASNHLVCRANRTIEGSGNRAAGGMRNHRGSVTRTSYEYWRIKRTERARCDGV
jgi:hypothetical protein